MFSQILSIHYMILGLVSTQVTKLPPIVRKVAGGARTTIDVYPFMVSIQFRFGTHFCGGTILKPMWVLTAGHCVFIRDRPNRPAKRISEKDMVVLAGSTDCRREISDDGQLRNVVVFYLYEDFDYQEIRNDIGIIQVDTPFVLNGFNMAAVVLPRKKIDSASIHDLYDKCVTAGWGSTKIFGVESPSMYPNTTLSHVELSLMSVGECLERTTYRVRYYMNMCTYSPLKDACKGDSGGPLLCNRTQMGITSWGYECARALLPGIWTRVDNYLDWIHETMARPIRNAAAKTTFLCDIVATVPILSLQRLLFSNVLA